MKDKDAKIFVTSIKNVSKRLEYYGDLNIDKISLLKLIYKYANYCSTYSQIQRLDAMVNQLQREDNLICNEFQSVSGFVYPNVFKVVPVSGDDVSNEAPVITDNSFTVLASEESFLFSSSSIYFGYSDAEGTQPSGFIIKSLPSIGDLYYDEEDIILSTVYSDPSLLSYERIGTSSYTDSFTWAVFDSDTQLPMESNIATMTGTIEEFASTNQDPYVGDQAIYKSNRATTVFSSADFTTSTTAPYLDPEGDDLAFIRIDEISEANEGKYFFFNNEITASSVPQIISKAELDSGAFYHVGPDSNAVTTDSFNASIQTENNPNWVS